MSNRYKKDISQAEFERIERFLLGRMDEAEQVQFEADLARDEALRLEVGLQRQLLAAVESGSVNVDELPKRQRTLNGRYRWLAAAASVVLAVGIWYAALRQSPEEKLFAAYFVAPKGLVTPMTATDDYVFYDGMVDYKQENYRQAITKWSPLLQQRPENDTLHFFIGVAHLSAGDALKSIPYLEHTASVTESAFNDEAWFYLGMAMLKIDTTAEARVALAKSQIERSQAVLRRLEE